MPIIIPDGLPYTAPGIECLRLGARRGGTGIGCCAIDVIQGFNNDPDAICPATPHYDGDSWTPTMKGDNHVCVGGEGITNEQAFLSYITHGSFTLEPEPDHAWIASLTGDQCESDTGKKWLAILKREGFQWVGCTSNSVYSDYHPNHIFLLTRATHEHMDEHAIELLKKPPSAWEELPPPTKTPEERFDTLRAECGKAHTRQPFAKAEEEKGKAPEKAEPCTLGVGGFSVTIPSISEF